MRKQKNRTALLGNNAVRFLWSCNGAESHVGGVQLSFQGRRYIQIGRDGWFVATASRSFSDTPASHAPTHEWDIVVPFQPNHYC